MNRSEVIARLALESGFISEAHHAMLMRAISRASRSGNALPIEETGLEATIFTPEMVDDLIHQLHTSTFVCPVCGWTGPGEDVATETRLVCPSCQEPDPDLVEPGESNADIQIPPDLAGRLKAINLDDPNGNGNGNGADLDSLTGESAVTSGDTLPGLRTLSERVEDHSFLPDWKLSSDSGLAAGDVGFPDAGNPSAPAREAEPVDEGGRAAGDVGFPTATDSRASGRAPVAPASDDVGDRGFPGSDPAPRPSVRPASGRSSGTFDTSAATMPGEFTSTKSEGQRDGTRSSRRQAPPPMARGDAGFPGSSDRLPAVSDPDASAGNHPAQTASGSYDDVTAPGDSGFPGSSDTLPAMRLADLQAAVEQVNAQNPPASEPRRQPAMPTTVGDVGFPGSHDDLEDPMTSTHISSRRQEAVRDRGGTSRVDSGTSAGLSGSTTSARSLPPAPAPPPPPAPAPPSSARMPAIPPAAARTNSDDIPDDEVSLLPGGSSRRRMPAVGATGIGAESIPDDEVSLLGPGASSRRQAVQPPMEDGTRRSSRARLPSVQEQEEATRRQQRAPGRGDSPPAAQVIPSGGVLASIPSAPPAPAAPKVNVDDIPPGTRIADWSIEERVGKGAVGVVYRARDVELDRQVAIKFLSRDLLTAGVHLDRFRQEARTLAQLEHPNILSVHRLGYLEDRPYIVMQWIDGESMEARVKRNAQDDTTLGRLKLMIQAARGLAAAHVKGIVHRDVKPDNLMITRDGVVKVADFGLARSTSDSRHTLSRTGDFLGTPAVSAPEQIEGSSDVDGRADIYSLGITMFRVLTGRWPYAAKSLVELINHHTHTPLPPACQVNPNLPVEVDLLLEEMCAKSPANRLPDMTIVVERLEKMIRDFEGGRLRPAGSKDRDARDTGPLPDIYASDQPLYPGATMQFVKARGRAPAEIEDDEISAELSNDVLGAYLKGSSAADTATLWTRDSSATQPAISDPNAEAAAAAARPVPKPVPDALPTRERTINYSRADEKPRAISGSGAQPVVGDKPKPKESGGNTGMILFWLLVAAALTFVGLVRSGVLDLGIPLP